MAMEIEVDRSTLRLKAPFRIAGHVFDTSPIVTVTLRDGDHVGRGEASSVFFLGDTAETIAATLAATAPATAALQSRDELRTLLPPGGARNAVDAAMWELEAARSGSPVSKLAGLAAP